MSTLAWGSGDKTFVFLHYFGGAARSWQWVAAQLPDYHCLALNLPGFGGTPALPQPSLSHYANAIAAELARLKLGDYVLVGHSMGGKMALQLAVTSDCLPQHVVLIAPSPPTQEPMPAAEKERLLHHHPCEETAQATVKSATRQLLSAEQQAVAVQTHLAVDNTTWRWWLLEGMTHSIASQMSQLQMPVTILASKDDPVIPYATMQTDVLALIPKAQLVPTQRIGHLLPLEAAAWIANQLRRVV